MDAVKIKDLIFSYSSTPLLKIADFLVKKGERLFLYGPSGSGKSSLLEILAGILVPQSGTVEIQGQNLAILSARQRDAFRADHEGYIFQSFNLIPYLTVRENIELPGRLSPRRREKGSGAAYEHLVQALNIRELGDRRVTDLSIGQQQRVAAARALFGKPEILLADEPTSALDYDHRERFLQLLFRLASEESMTVLFVSHDRSLEKLFDRTVALASINAQKSPAVDNGRDLGGS